MEIEYVALRCKKRYVFLDLAATVNEKVFFV